MHKHDRAQNKMTNVTADQWGRGERRKQGKQLAAMVIAWESLDQSLSQVMAMAASKS